MGDPVNHPAHYHPGKHEVIDVIHEWGLDFTLGNVVKYVARHALKGTPLEDLSKARWYLEHAIAQLTPEQAAWTFKIVENPMHAGLEEGNLIRKVRAEAAAEAEEHEKARWMGSIAERWPELPKNKGILEAIEYCVREDEALAWLAPLGMQATYGTIAGVLSASGRADAVKAFEIAAVDREVAKRRVSEEETIANLVAERGERLRQLERAADENNRLITAQTKAISERDVALADLQVERNACAGLKHRVMTLETMADVPDVMVRLGNANCQRDEALTQLEEARAELAKLKTDAPTPAPAGYVDERDHRRALSQLDAMTKERDGAVHALAAAKSERDMARRSLAEAQHEVEAARKLHTEGGGSHVYVRRIEKALEIITSITQTPAMKDLRAVLLGEKP